MKDTSVIDGNSAGGRTRASAESGSLVSVEGLQNVIARILAIEDWVYCPRRCDGLERSKSCDCAWCDARRLLSSTGSSSPGVSVPASPPSPLPSESEKDTERLQLFIKADEKAEAILESAGLSRHIDYGFLRGGRDYGINERIELLALDSKRLKSLIELTNNEGDKGEWSVTLDYDNYHDGARVLNANGRVIAECYEVGKTPEEQFGLAIDAAMESEKEKKQ